MTVKDLMEKLKDQPEGNEVLIYIDEVEEYGECDGVSELDLSTEEGREEAPYSKVEVPTRNKPVTLINGWTTI